MEEEKLEGLKLEHHRKLDFARMMYYAGIVVSLGAFKFSKHFFILLTSGASLMFAGAITEQQAAYIETNLIDEHSSPDIFETIRWMKENLRQS